MFCLPTYSVVAFTHNVVVVQNIFHGMYTECIFNLKLRECVCERERERARERERQTDRQKDREREIETETHRVIKRETERV